MVYNGQSEIKMDDDWGYSYFRTPPSVWFLSVPSKTSPGPGPFEKPRLPRRSPRHRRPRSDVARRRLREVHALGGEAGADALPAAGCNGMGSPWLQDSG